MATLKLTNVKKVYENKVTAVHDFNLDVEDKEFIVFVGPSGCGKSTTLRMIAGLEDISGGTVEIDGRVVNDLPPKSRNIAMVFQNYALYPHLTVFENIAFPLRLMKQEVEVDLTEKEKAKLIAKLEGIKLQLDDPKTNPKKVPTLERVKEETLALLEKGTKTDYRKMANQEIYDKVTAVANTLGITEYLARKPRALSGGQRQRVAIGRAMVRDSKILLMDEPLSNLDAKLRNQMRAEIILLRKKIDSTFVYVTHDQTEAMTLGDRIVIMKDGYIQQVGTPQEVFDTPANLFVAGFIGAPQMNFFNEAVLEKVKDKYTVEIKGVKFDVDGANGQLLAEHGVEEGPVVLGVRPEHMAFSLKPSAQSLKCSVVVSEMMGSELHLHLECVDGSQIIVRVPTVELTDDERRSANTPGSTVYITFSGKVMHLFDKESEISLLHPEYEYVTDDTAGEEVEVTEVVEEVVVEEEVTTEETKE